MAEDVSRLVLRRTNNEINDKIAIRLDKDVDRTADLTALLQAGIVVEVIDIEKSDTSDNLFVTLGFNAPKDFQIDRVEKILYPRNGYEIGDERAIAYPVFTATEAADLSLADVEAALARVEEGMVSLEGQIKRVRRDRSKAAERGYAPVASARHHEWIMISEELDALQEQLAGAQVSKRQLVELRKRKRTAAHLARKEIFAGHFMKLAKDRMGKKEYDKIQQEARALADGQRSVA